jgi:hypothetical protein
MNMYEMVCTVFEDSDPGFDRLVGGLERSVLHNCASDARLTICEMARPESNHRLPMHTDNTVKLRHWCEVMREAERAVVFLDADCLVLRDLGAVFDGEADWDVAITVWGDARNRLNAGVVFARPTEGARGFFEDWVAENERLFADTARLDEWQSKQPGMNQPALRQMMERGEHRGNAIELPCAVYNACEPTQWQAVGAETHVLHVKGSLRRQMIGNAAETRYPVALGLVMAYVGGVNKTNGSDRNDGNDAAMGERVGLDRARRGVGIDDPGSGGAGAE